MAILGLSDPNSRSLEKGIKLIGKLRKGGKQEITAKGKIKPGEDLDHFRLVLDPLYEGFRNEIEKIWGTTPTEIHALLLGHDVDSVFDNWNESRTKTKLLHQCDGETQQRAWLEDEKRYTRKGETLPCLKGSPVKNPRAVCSGECVRVGRLYITHPVINRIVGEMVKFQVLTSSIHDIINLSSQLEGKFRLYGTLNFLPVYIGRKNEEKTRPDDTYGRASANFSLLYIRTEKDEIDQYMHKQLERGIQLNGQFLLTSINDSYQLTEKSQPAIHDGKSNADNKIGIDPESIADWLADKLKTPITAPDVVQIFANNNFNYAEANPNMKLYAVALVLEAWNTDGVGNVMMDLIESQAHTLLPKSPDAVDYIMSVVLGTD